MKLALKKISLPNKVKVDLKFHKSILPLKLFDLDNNFYYYLLKINKNMSLVYFLLELRQFQNSLSIFLNIKTFHTKIFQLYSNFLRVSINFDSLFILKTHSYLEINELKFYYYIKMLRNIFKTRTCHMKADKIESFLNDKQQKEYHKKKFYNDLFQYTISRNATYKFIENSLNAQKWLDNKSFKFNESNLVMNYEKNSHFYFFLKILISYYKNKSKLRDNSRLFLYYVNYLLRKRKTNQSTITLKKRVNYFLNFRQLTIKKKKESMYKYILQNILRKRITKWQLYFFFKQLLLSKIKNIETAHKLDSDNLLAKNPFIKHLSRINLF